MKMRWLIIGGIALAGVGGVTATAVSLTSAPAPVRTATPGDWLHQGGSRLLRTLGDDFTALGVADRTWDLPSMALGCRHLLADVRTAQADPVIPNPKTQKLWAEALDSFAHGATDCANGAAASDYALIIRASTEIERGSADINQVSRLLPTTTGA